MKKTIICLLSVFVLTALSCTKDFDKVNTNPSSFTAAEPEAVLPGVFLNFINRVEFTNIRTLWEYGHQIDPIGRYNTGDEQNWTVAYTQVLGNTKQLKNLYTGKAEYANRLAITDIWECYVYFYLTASYGPVPYSHMGDTSNPDVEYD